MTTMTTGLTAGVFADWSSAVMPGLSDVDDRTFVEAFQGLDAAITDPLFLGLGYPGALLSIGLSAAVHLDGNAELAVARAQLDESMWTAWNTVRALAATIGFGCLSWALVTHRRLGQTTVRRAAR